MKEKILIVLALTFALCSCAKPDAEFVHDKCEIESVTVTVPGSAIAPEVSGTLRTDIRAGEQWWVFAIPRDYPARYGFDPSSLKVVAKLPYDVFLTPGLEGRKDLSLESDPLKVVAKNQTTGQTRTYYLFAYISTSL